MGLTSTCTLMPTFEPPKDRPIRMCVCHDRTFAELKLSGLQSLEEIANEFGCSTSCGLCRPYIERMLQTGETAFAVLD